MPKVAGFSDVPIDDVCSGVDPYGTVSCLMDRLTQIRIGIEACGFPLDDPARRLIEYQKKLLAYYARNAYPPRQPEELEQEFQMAVQAFRKVLEAPYFEERDDCEEYRSPDSNLQKFKAEFFEALLDPQAVAKFDRFLETPRLPLWTYCTSYSYDDVYNP